MKIGIIGAGATGLTAAYRLAGSGCDVVVYERERESGGLVKTVNIGGEDLECFYHHIFTSDLDLIGLIDELGLGSDLLWLTPSNGIYLNHRLYPFTSPLDLLLFKELNFWERIRLGLLVLEAKTVKDWRRLESITAKEWVLQKAGPNVYHKIWGPLLNSKFDHDAEIVSAAWLWNKFKLRGSTRGKNIQREMLGYLKGSFGRVYRRLEAEILKAGGRILHNRAVERIIPRPDGALEVSAGGQSEIFDRVICTAAPEILAGLIRENQPSYAADLEKVRYKANICVILELTERLTPYYWTSITQPDSPFVAVIEQTNLLPASNYQSHLVYLSRYLDATDQLFHASQEKVVELFIAYLYKIFPGFNQINLKKAHLFKARYTQPVVVTDYSRIIPELKTPVPNLYLASMAQIYPEDRGQNYAVRMGNQIARCLLEG
ncbi:MAG: NAD(P)/FAD-dependent oxidoreductase [Firmicutes bacterium]|nr:NAD(P)/FAD-dependent oxidoreductase [Bacillota bacterium]